MMTIIKLHEISNLNLNFMEWEPSTESGIPECDLIVFNGSNGDKKRSMSYIEKICHNYSNVNAILNMDRFELGYQKYKTEVIDGFKIRQRHYEGWPKNLLFRYEEPFVLEFDGVEVDFFCLHGYPKVVGEPDPEVWERTYWSEMLVHGVTEDVDYERPTGISDAPRGTFPVWSTPELCRADHDREAQMLKDWLEDRSGRKKILVTAISPISDPRLEGVPYTIFDGLEPDYWITGGYVGEAQIGKTRLHGNAGRGAERRGTVFNIDLG